MKQPDFSFLSFLLRGVKFGCDFVPVSLGHFRNKDPSNGCYTQLSFSVQIVKRKSLS